MRCRHENKFQAGLRKLDLTSDSSDHGVRAEDLGLSTGRKPTSKFHSLNFAGAPGLQLHPGPPPQFLLQGSEDQCGGFDSNSNSLGLKQLMSVPICMDATITAGNLSCSLVGG